MRKYSSSKNEICTEKWQERLDMSWWLVGFVDGEGTFSVSIFRNKTSKNGWQVFPEFVITQGSKSLEALLSVKEFLGCGNVYINRRKDNHLEDLYRFCVRSKKDLKEKIIPFFNSFCLKSSKKHDFDKFSKILSMMEKSSRSNNDIKKIALIVENMNRKKKSAYLESPEAIRQNPI